MPVLALALAAVLLAVGTVGYLLTGAAWLLVLAGIGVVAGAGGWVLTRDAMRRR